MENLTLATFKQKVFDFEKSKEWTYSGELPAIIDFYADWCAPCRRISPMLEELAKEYAGKIHIYKIDTEKEAELAELFGIRSIPSLLFIPMTAPPQMVGGMPKEIMVNAIHQVLKVPNTVST
jgi:thioredoxin